MLTISWFLFIVIVIAALILGWVGRSFMVRMHPTETREFDNYAKSAGNRVEDGFDAAKSRAQAALNRTKQD